MRVELSEKDGYTLDQQATAKELLLKQHGFGETNDVHIPAGEERITR